MMAKGNTHWLVRIAGRAGLRGAETLDIEATAPLQSAWEAVIAGCGIGEDDLTHRIAQTLHLQVADLDHVQRRALKLLPEPLIRRYQVLPLREDDHILYVATADPLDFQVEQEAAFASGRRPVFEIASPRAILEAIDAHYSTDYVVESLLRSVDRELQADLAVVGETGDPAAPGGESETGPIIQLTNYILRDAIRKRASDIHLQPGAAKAVVRLRVDGVLQPALQIPLTALQRVISRIKVLANMDIADRLRPQDGRMRVQVEGRDYDLRISTVPTREAEKAVVRILASQGTIRLEDLDFPAREASRLRELLAHRNGIIIVTGPTGSGKTTTLYAAICELATSRVNVMTVEDPVEYDLPGITQIQVEPRKGVTFGSALRAILRQDPDIIFVGEIRDLETATVAVQASMTGHLVLATLHTNDAASAITRLCDLGLDRASIANTLRGVIAQRLVRRLCPHCAQPVSDPLDAEEARLASLHHTAPVMRAVGCARCGSSGYLGRTPVAEVLVLTPPLLQRIQAQESAAEVERAAIASGNLRRLAVAGLDLVRSGETTFEEFDRVLGAGVEESAPEQPRPVHILLAEDDPEDRILARTLLEKSGYQVSEAENGQAAVDFLAARTDVDLLLLDLIMPKLSGGHVLSRVRSDARTAALPVVILTGLLDEGTEIRLMEEGADDYIRKPLEPGLFLARIRAALRRAGR